LREPDFLALIALSGVLDTSGVFYSGPVVLGAGSGVATVSNLSLMLDMTIPSSMGLYMGAWGMALLMLVSLMMLSRIDVRQFHKQAEDHFSVVETFTRVD
jgi:hypothetical protein